MIQVSFVSNENVNHTCTMICNQEGSKNGDLRSRIHKIYRAA